VIENPRRKRNSTKEEQFCKSKTSAELGERGERGKERVNKSSKLRKQT
jgi:hypothetical protein